jgi:hypothetical protein
MVTFLSAKAIVEREMFFACPGGHHRPPLNRAVDVNQTLITTVGAPPLMLQSTGCRIGLDPDRRTPITYSSGSLSAPRTAAALILGRSQTSSGLFFWWP